MDERAVTELSCKDLHEAIEVFRGIGFHVLTIVPADDPAYAVIDGHGVRLRLVHDGHPCPPVPPLDGAPLVPSFVVTNDDPDAWRVGRASMSYRDLVPDRQGGRFIASHIKIAHGGPVPDYVHFHAVGFQMIYVYKGWVRLVYEDQGEPFVMNAGEIVLQPPRIRHRVLESSPGLEVVEVGSPAVHTTHGDPKMTLPTAEVREGRVFSGQRFTCGRPEDERIAKASGGRAGARIVRGAPGDAPAHAHDLLFGFVLAGAMDVTCDGRTARVASAGAFTIPRARPFSLTGGTADLEWLEITAPAAPV